MKGSMKIEELRKALQTRPRLALQWAKRFHFCETKYHHEYPEYDERAFLAYQALLWAVNKDPRMVLDWLLPFWESNAHHIQWQTFGKHPNIEFDYVREFVESVVNKIVSERPLLIRNWIVANFGTGNRFNSLVQNWAESVFDKNPTKGLGMIKELFALFPAEIEGHHPYQASSMRSNVVSVLRKFYQKNPEKIMSFFERNSTRLKGIGSIMDEVLK